MEVWDCVGCVHTIIASVFLAFNHIKASTLNSLDYINWNLVKSRNLQKKNQRLLFLNVCEFGVKVIKLVVILGL